MLIFQAENFEVQVMKKAQIRYNSEIKWEKTLWLPLVTYKMRGGGGGGGGGGGWFGFSHTSFSPP